MAYMFYVIGWFGVICGGAWAAVVFRAASATSGANATAGGSIMAGVAGLTTQGLSLLFFGLLMLAIGGGLARLDGILRHSRQTARIIKEMSERTAG